MELSYKSKAKKKLLPKVNKKAAEYVGPIYKLEWEEKYNIPVLSLHENFLGLGYSLVFLCSSLHVKSDCRTSECLIDKHFNGYGARALASGYAKHKRYVLAVNNDDIDKRKLLKLIIHELSHVVDHIFENCSIKNVDTEVRAYLIDHLFEKIARTLIID